MLKQVGLTPVPETDSMMLKRLWRKFLTWLKQGYVSVAFHAASTASHIVDAVLF